ncbi:hypothetical protein SDC9_108867 [bioreactor metagenome]|uniref:Uncharacterized protein n=1 Tax=bioreactor metagenome TaxID=1076179 RepID=A0A645B998_9ZZZZ
MAALRYAAGVRKHQLRHFVVFQDADIHIEHVDIVLPRFVQVFHADTDLLNAGDDVIIFHVAFILRTIFLANPGKNRLI